MSYSYKYGIMEAPLKEITNFSNNSRKKSHTIPNTLIVNKYTWPYWNVQTYLELFFFKFCSSRGIIYKANLWAYFKV